MNEPRDNERRRFFRITDSIDISYRIIDANDDDSHTDEQNETVVDTRAVIQEYDQAIKAGLLELQDSHPAAIKPIEALSKKVDMLFKLLEFDYTLAQQYNHSIDAASISACGIAFPVNESFSDNTQLQIALLLKPSGHSLSIVGRVVDCETLEDDDSSHYLRVEFVDMSNLDRERLIQHIVQRQGALLKTLRDQFDELH